MAGTATKSAPKIQVSLNLVEELSVGEEVVGVEICIERFRKLIIPWYIFF